MTQLQNELYKSIDDQTAEIKALNEFIVNIKQDHEIQIEKW